MGSFWLTALLLPGLLLLLPSHTDLLLYVFALAYQPWGTRLHLARGGKIRGRGHHTSRQLRDHFDHMHDGGDPGSNIFPELRVRHERL